MKIFFTFCLIFGILNSFSAHAANIQKIYNDCDVSGSTTLYNLKENTWFQTDKDDAKIQTLPASTFKIVHTLITLDRSIVKKDSVFKWDGKKRDVESWNQDTRFDEAFKNSTLWVYEEIAQKINSDVYKRYLDWMSYGNGKITNGKNKNFWVYGEYGVSPIEQINMLVSLYKNELPFSIASINMVKSFMRLDDINGTPVYGKTGWTRHNDTHIGWFVGYLDVKNDPVFFATRILKNDDEPLGEFVSCRKSITFNILDAYQSEQIQFEAIP